MVTLGEVCEFKYGKSLPANQRDSGSRPVYGSNGIVGQHSQTLTDGPTIVIGRKGSFGEVNFSPTPCWPIDTTYYVDRTATNADLKWLSYRLSKLGLTELNKSAAVPGLNRDDAYRQRLLLPPLDEQRRIAAILDRADLQRTKQHAALDMVDGLEKSMFTHLFGTPSSNPMGWKKCPMSEVVFDIVSGQSPVCEARPAKGDEWAVLKLGAVSYGRFNDRENKAFLGNVRSIKRVEVRPGDFLLSRKNTKELVGATVVVGETPPRRLLPDLIFRIDLDHNKVVPEYLHGLLTNRSKRPQLVGLASGSASSMVNISQGRLLGLMIEVPPIELQLTFREHVRRVGAMRDQRENVSAHLDALFTSLQSRAFNGEL